MITPRTPNSDELPKIIEFLNKNLRKNNSWSISEEYPTALTTNNIHNVKILCDEDKIVSHAVLKPLVVKSPHLIYKIGTIGSVVTDPTYRGQGHSTQLINECIQEATKQQCDFVILWTDLYDFYRRMGFELAGSEVSILLDQPLNCSHNGLRFTDSPKVSIDAIARLYSQHSVHSVRSLEDFKKYLSIPQTKIYTAWTEKNQLAAYAIAGKGADLQGYLHEWGGQVPDLLALFSWIQKNHLSKLTVIAPKHSHNLIQQLKDRGASINDGFLGMIKIIHFDQLATKIKRAFRNIGVSQIVLEKNADGYLFGIGQDLFTLQNEADICRLLLGPVHFDSIDILNPKTKADFAKLLPLPLWLWGWDSI